VVPWLLEMQRACEASEWLVVEARGNAKAGWGCLLVYRGDAWGILLYAVRTIDVLVDRSPERLRRYATDLIRAPLAEAEARELLAAAPARRPETLAIPGEAPPMLLGHVVAWHGRDRIIADGGRELIVWDRATQAPVARNPIAATCRDAAPHLRPVIDEPTHAIAVADGVREFALWDLETLELIRVFRGHSEEVDGVAFVGDDRLISASGDATLRLWDRRTGACLRVLDVEPASCIAGARDAACYAAGGGSSEDGDGRIWIVDRDLHLVREIPVPVAPATYAPLSKARAKSIGSVARDRSDASVHAIAWLPDGRHVVTGGWDFVAKLYDTATGELVRTWTGHSFWVDAVAISPDGARLATASGDGHVRVWSTGSSECLADYEPGPKVEGVCFAGDRIYASGDNGTVYVFP
jgi:hypothetical protein